ncbi:MAG TPA: hypothetical protein VJU14_10090 [Solirubrobacterales bacterium]|nr:hypothetical protein [Solirubrobacterales bacterium]
MKTWRAILSVAAAAFALVALPSTSGANNLSTLDTDPVSDGHVIVDAGGNAYVSWVSEGAGTAIDPVRFCKIAPGGACAPITLSIPGGTSISDSAAAAIPVFGPGGTVYVVAPRYAQNDLFFWTSTNGGLSFDGGTERAFYSNKTDPTDAFLVGSTFYVGAYNPGVGFSTAERDGLGGGSLNFANPGSGGVLNSSMALDGANPVIAYSNLSDPYSLFFYRYKGAGSPNAEVNWEGPAFVTNGYEPSLASGPAGLFMVSQDYSGGQYPNAVNVRRYTGTGFGPAKTLAIDASTNLFAGGAIAQSPSGNRLAVAWPGRRAGDNAYVMRLFTSTDAGANYSESHIAHLGDAYSLNDNADLATNDAGTGWLLFRNSTGLQLADLAPIASLPPPPPPLPGIYKGKTKKIVKKVGDYLIILRLPKSCLQSRQRFFVGVGKRKRKQLSKKLGGKIRFTKVVFIYDGKKLKVKKKKPFRYLIDPGPMAAGSVHRVKARVTMVLTRGEKEKTLKRVIKGTVRACR